MSKNDAQTPPSAEDIKALAEKLTSDVLTPVAKSDEVPADEKEDEKPEEKEVEKAAAVLDEALITALTERVAQRAASMIDEKFAAIQKSLDAQASVSDSVLTYVKGSINVLTQVKDQGAQFIEKADDLKEVAKSIQVEVEAIGDKPAAPRAVVVDEKPIEKAAPVTPEVSINEDALKEVQKAMKAEGMDGAANAFTLGQYIKSAQYDLAATLITPKQRRMIGLSQ